MLEVRLTRLVPLPQNEVFLQWEVEARDTPAGASTLQMAVYRSESPAGPWTLVSSALEDQFYFTDTLNAGDKAHFGALSRNWYYYVRAVNGVEEANSKSMDLFEVSQDILEQRESLPTRFQDLGLHRDRKRLVLIRRKILRDLWILLSKVEGRKYAILKRRHMGTRCTNDECWDPATRQALLQNCPVCRGVGWVDGYYNPFYTLAIKKPAPVQETDNEAQGQRETHRFMFLHFPYLEEDDVIVDVETNERFKLGIVTPTEVKGVRVQQYTTGNKLSRDDAAYTIEVDREVPLTSPISTGWH